MNGPEEVGIETGIDYGTDRLFSTQPYIIQTNISFGNVHLRGDPDAEYADIDQGDKDEGADLQLPRPLLVVDEKECAVEDDLEDTMHLAGDVVVCQLGRSGNGRGPRTVRLA